MGGRGPAERRRLRPRDGGIPAGQPSLPGCRGSGSDRGDGGQSVAITAIGAAILADGAGVQTALVLGGLAFVLGALILVAIKPPKLVQL